MFKDDKPLVWLDGKVKSPPFSKAARIQAGFLLRQLQYGRKLELPHSRPMPGIGARCHELRINDEHGTWRNIYKVESDLILILEIFEKKTSKAPKYVIDTCKERIKKFNHDIS